jgi:hypothetical protein
VAKLVEEKKMQSKPPLRSPVERLFLVEASDTAYRTGERDEGLEYPTWIQA